jgi:diadenosine tetraphosphate (Ap4A) HIT family hydrolase
MIEKSLSPPTPQPNKRTLEYLPGPCPFCQQLADKSPSIIYQGKYNFVLLSNDNALPEALLVCPKRHIETVFDMHHEEWEELYEIIQRCRQALAENYPVDGFTVGWNCYPAGGQSIAHCHLHIISRSKDEIYTRGRGIRGMLKRKENRNQADRPEQKRVHI